MAKNFRYQTLALLAALTLCIFQGHAQSAPKAEAARLADLQVGLLGVAASPDYSPHVFYGYGAYIGFDFTHHYGVEASLKQLDSRNTDNISERTMQIGARYVRHYRDDRYAPFLRASVGLGTFQFPYGLGVQTYRMSSYAAGTDVQVSRRVTVRAEYEYQRWPLFPPRGLLPNMLTVGVGFHIH